jgi:hypothetical protein
VTDAKVERVWRNDDDVEVCVGDGEKNEETDSSHLGAEIAFWRVAGLPWPLAISPSTNCRAIPLKIWPVPSLDAQGSSPADRMIEAILVP